jgi:RNA-directed DNA polymerase
LHVSRIEFDRLKAMPTNCARHGATDQNHSGAQDIRAHLLGKIFFVEMIHPARGEILLRLLERIEW